MRHTVVLLLCLCLTFCMFTSTVFALIEEDNTQNPVSFHDIDKHNAKTVIERWAKYGVVKGSPDGRFRPDDNITRAELAAIIAHLTGYSSQSAQKPLDIDEKDWFYSDIMKLLAANVLRGAKGYVRPHDSATREEAVIIIARTFKISERLDGRIDFLDRNDISSWAKGLISNMKVSGYLDIFGDTFLPHEYITRAEVLLIVDSMFAAYYAQPGTYSESVNGNVIINSPNVVLKNARIEGDLYIMEGVGNGYYTLDSNTVIKGRVIITGGKANPYPHIDPSAPMVALTFDDGPTITTVKILDTLETYNARATFFIVGKNIDAHKDTLRRALDLGCELASHTWSHTSLTSMSTDSLITDAERVSNAIFKTVGIKPVFVRPPGGSYSSAANSAFGTIGMAIAMWSIDPQDWSHLNSDTTYTRIMNNLKDGAIVLLHDLVPSTGTAVEKLIPDLIENGYQLVTLSEMLTYSTVGIKPGVLYVSKYEYKH